MINKSIYFNRNMKMQVTQSGDQFGFNQNSVERVIERESTMKSRKVKLKRGMNSKFRLPSIENNPLTKEF